MSPRSDRSFAPLIGCGLRHVGSIEDADVCVTSREKLVVADRVFARCRPWPAWTRHDGGSSTISRKRKTPAPLPTSLLEEAPLPKIPPAIEPPSETAPAGRIPAPAFAARMRALPALNHTSAPSVHEDSRQHERGDREPAEGPWPAGGLSGGVRQNRLARAPQGRGDW